jgi:uncharacterized protein (DUF58 family)
MMVPSKRLINYALLLGVPIAILGGLAPSVAPLAAAVAAVLVLCVLVDGAISTDRLEGLKAQVHGVQRLALGVEGEVEVMLENEKGQDLRLRAGLRLPADATSSKPEARVRLTAKRPRFRLRWPVTGHKRGSYILPSLHVERSSLLGLWDLRRTLNLNGELRVYPGLGHERRQMAHLFLKRGLGTRVARLAGQGREFEKLREYVSGDTFNDIHWKATARKARPITKVFQVERTQQVVVVVDSSRLSGRPAMAVEGEGGDDATFLDRQVNAALALRLATMQQGDHYGLVAFADKVQRYLPPRAGRAHANACRDALYGLFPTPVTPDYNELFSWLRGTLRRRALLLFLTSLDDPVLAESFERGLGLLSREHLVQVVMPKPRDAAAAFNAPLARDRDLADALAGDLRFKELRLLEKRLRARGAGFVLADDTRLSVELVTQYLRIKERQLL